MAERSGARFPKVKTRRVQRSHRVRQESESSRQGHSLRGSRNLPVVTAAPVVSQRKTLSIPSGPDLRPQGRRRLLRSACVTELAVKAQTRCQAPLPRPDSETVGGRLTPRCSGRHPCHVKHLRVLASHTSGFGCHPRRVSPLNS